MSDKGPICLTSVAVITVSVMVNVLLDTKILQKFSIYCCFHWKQLSVINMQVERDAISLMWEQWWYNRKKKSKGRHKLEKCHLVIFFSLLQSKGNSLGLFTEIILYIKAHVSKSSFQKMCNIHVCQCILSVVLTLL